MKIEAMTTHKYENFPSRARVVVVGGGVGASTFYHPTTHDWKDVVLIERDEWASGTTWHSAGQVSQFGTVHIGDPTTSGGDIVGVVTSGAYGFTVEKNLALGYVDPSFATPGTELTVRIIGQDSPAVVVEPCVFDEAHQRPRAHA